MNAIIAECTRTRKLTCNAHLHSSKHMQTNTNSHSTYVIHPPSSNAFIHPTTTTHTNKQNPLLHTHTHHYLPLPPTPLQAQHFPSPSLTPISPPGTPAAPPNSRVAAPATGATRASPGQLQVPFALARNRGRGRRQSRPDAAHTSASTPTGWQQVWPDEAGAEKKFQEDLLYGRLQSSSSLSQQEEKQDKGSYRVTEGFCLINKKQ